MTLSVSDGLIGIGNHIVVSKVMRDKLSRIHDGHQGLSKSEHSLKRLWGDQKSQRIFDRE